MSRGRLRAVAAFVAFWCLAIAVRLVALQVVEHDLYRQKAKRQQQRVVDLYPARGTIYDAAGRELAVSIQVESAWADPEEVDDPRATARAVARVVPGVDAGDLARSLADRDKGFVWVARRLDPPVARALAALKLPGISFQRESKRYYPNRELAAAVLGYVGTDNHGLGGLEHFYDKKVTGRAGRRTVLRDARHDFAVDPKLAFADPEPGYDLYLTLDASIQYLAERELAATVEAFHAKGGSAVLLDPTTGAVLAMASYPGFDPNRFTDYPPSAWNNSAIADAYEPGSTFKMVTAAAALTANVIDPNDVLDCEMGAITSGGDPHPRPQAVRPAHLPRGDLQVEQRRRHQDRPTGGSRPLLPDGARFGFRPAHRHRPARRERRPAAAGEALDAARGLRVVRPGDLDHPAPARPGLRRGGQRRHPRPPLSGGGGGEPGRRADRAPGAAGARPAALRGHRPRAGAPARGGGDRRHRQGGGDPRLPGRRQDRDGAEGDRRQLLRVAFRRQLRRLRPGPPAGGGRRGGDRRAAALLPRWPGGGAGVRGRSSARRCSTSGCRRSASGPRSGRASRRRRRGSPWPPAVGRRRPLPLPGRRRARTPGDPPRRADRRPAGRRSRRRPAGGRRRRGRGRRPRLPPGRAGRSLRRLAGGALRRRRLRAAGGGGRGGGGAGAHRRREHRSGRPAAAGRRRRALAHRPRSPRPARPAGRPRLPPPRPRADPGRGHRHQRQVDGGGAGGGDPGRRRPAGRVAGHPRLHLRRPRLRRRADDAGGLGPLPHPAPDARRRGAGGGDRGFLARPVAGPGRGRRLRRRGVHQPDPRPPRLPPRPRRLLRRQATAVRDAQAGRPGGGQPRRPLRRPPGRRAATGGDRGDLRPPRAGGRGVGGPRPGRRGGHPWRLRHTARRAGLLVAPARRLQPG